MNLQKILREQEKLDARDKHSTVDRITGKLLHLLVKIKKPKNVLEIRTSIGYSGVWIASALPKNSKFTTIEIWHERIELAKKFFKRAKLPVNAIEGNALEIIPKLKTKFDFVFIDAMKKEYLEYLKTVKLNKNALIVADNTISHRGKMKDFLEYVNKKGAITLNVGKGLTLLELR